MIVKFHSHGKGPASGALDYLLKEKAERTAENANDKRVPLVPRAHARVLSGDPVITEHLINTTPYQQKYKSGVLSFEKRANELSEKEKFEIMQKFEDAIFCGLERDQFDILWIEHADKDIDKDNPVGRLELNFLIPGQELRSGKRLQPFYAGADLVRVNAFKDIINHDYKLADPNAPNRKRLVNNHSESLKPPTPYDIKNYSQKNSKKDDEIIADPSNREALRAAINRKMKLAYEQNMAINRSSVLLLLKKWGLNVERARNEKSISVSSNNLVDKNGKTINVKLTGALYEKDFNGVNHEPHIIKLKHKAYVEQQPYAYQRAAKRLAKGCEIKAQYHAEIYKEVITPEPLNLVVVDVAIEKDSSTKVEMNNQKQLDTYSPTFDF